MSTEKQHTIDHGGGWRTVLPAVRGAMKFSDLSAAERCELMINGSDCTRATRAGRTVRWMPRAEFEEQQRLEALNATDRRAAC